MTLLGRPTSPADTGLPALRIVSRTFAVVSIFFCLFDVVVPVFCRDVLEGTVTFDVVGIEVFSLASP